MTKYEKVNIYMKNGNHHSFGDSEVSYVSDVHIDEHFLIVTNCIDYDTGDKSYINHAYCISDIVSYSVEEFVEKLEDPDDYTAKENFYNYRFLVVLGIIMFIILLLLFISWVLGSL